MSLLDSLFVSSRHSVDPSSSPYFLCNTFFFFYVFLEPHPRHVEVPRIGAKSELSPPAYATATAMRDPSGICDLHHSSQQHQILNPLN